MSFILHLVIGFVLLVIATFIGFALRLLFETARHRFHRWIVKCASRVPNARLARDRHGFHYVRPSLVGKDAKNMTSGES